MNKAKETSLALTGMTPKELGENLIEAATENSKRKIITEAVSYVSDLMAAITNAERIIKTNQDYITVVDGAFTRIGFYVSDLMAAITNAERIIKTNQDYITDYRVKLKAIETGEFYIDPYSKKIVYTKL